MLRKIAIADPGLYRLFCIFSCILLLGGAIGGFIPFNDVAHYDLWLATGYFFAIFLSAVVIVAGIMLQLIIAGYFYFLGVDKGYTDTFYLRLCFFFTVIGYLMIIAMPNTAAKYANTTALPNDDLPDL